MEHADRSNPATQSRLKSDLEAIGLGESDVVMLHVSLKSIGWIVGGADSLLQALTGILLPEGTLTMMIGWEDYPYHMADWEPLVQADYREACPPFDPGTSRANHREFGILTEYLRTYPADVQRSRHPTCSFAAIGRHARLITENHPLQYGFGRDSPLDRLYKLNGKVLHIGCPLNTLTLLHYAEDRCQLTDKRIVRYQMPLLIDGHRQWVELEEYDTSEGICQWEGEDYFELIAREYIAQGRIDAGKIGEAAAYLFDAVDLVDFAVDWMERNF